MKKAATWLVLFIIFGCTPTADHDQQAIRELIRNIIAADNKADIEAVISCYHPDASLLPPGKPPINGAEAIRKNYETIFSSSILELKIQEDEITLADDYAICTGLTRGQVLSKIDSTTRVVNDKFVMILQKRDQVWKIKSLFWN
jgi:uncharacterized protein (TIGR02246 family)